MPCYPAEVLVSQRLSDRGVQGLLRMRKDTFKKSSKVVRLWKHECERVFKDRMVSLTDMEKYDDMMSGVIKNWFKEEPLDELNAQPNLFCSFMVRCVCVALSECGCCSLKVINAGVLVIMGSCSDWVSVSRVLFFGFKVLFFGFKGSLFLTHARCGGSHPDDGFNVGMCPSNSKRVVLCALSHTNSPLCPYR